MSAFGCAATRLEGDRSAAFFAWAAGEGPAPVEEAAGAGLAWLLAYSDAGVTWGRLEGREWKLSASAFPEVSPPLVEGALHELRLFGRAAEIRLWRSGAELAGRRLADPLDAAGRGPLAPRDDRWLLEGDRLAGCRDGFALFTGRAGRLQALPLVIPEAEIEGTLPWRLEVRHYFEQDPDTGAVRVALTRLVGVVPGGSP